MKTLYTFRWLLLTGLIVAGIWAVVKIPEKVEEFLPVVATQRASHSSYNSTVSCSGVIRKEDEKWVVSACVGESDICKICIGQSAQIEGTAFPSDTFEAVVTGISDSARQNMNGLKTETVVDIYLEISDPSEILRSGYTAVANVSTSASRNVITVPYESVLQDAGGEFVYIIDGNRVIRKDILTGEELPDGVEIISGVSESDEIVLTPEKVSNNSLAKREENNGE